MTTWLWFFKLAVLLYLGVGLVLYLAQRQYMYFPTPAHESTAFDSEWIDSGGERIKLWVLAPGKPRALIYFGGNGEDTFYTAQQFAAHRLDATVYLVNYRGYGGSSGAPTEAGLYRDGLAVYDHVRERHEHLVPVGRSLGSSIAIRVAASRDAARLILVTPFDSAVGIARRLYPIYPVTWMLKDRYESVRDAPTIAVPTLVVTAEHDAIVPAASSQRLIERFSPELLEHHLIPGADHNDLSAHPSYMNALRRFL